MKILECTPQRKGNNTKRCAHVTLAFQQKCETYNYFRFSFGYIQTKTYTEETISVQGNQTCDTNIKLVTTSGNPQPHARMSVKKSDCK